MKIFVRDNQNNLSWQDAIYTKGYFRTPDERSLYYTSDIYAIKDDDRNKTVICSSCGKEIPNTKASIKAHKNMINKPDKCFGCGHLRQRDAVVLAQKYLRNEDGTYTESTKRTVTLTCNRSYSYPDINTAAARNCCRYVGCENATFEPIVDFWTQYPGAFDEFITIDRIIDSGVKGMHKYNTCIRFTLMFKPFLKAVVNNQGVCCCFELEHRQHSYTLRYSKKYDKVWVVKNTEMTALDSLDIAESTIKAIIKKLRTLYK
jgi:hypothetical protein